MSYAVLADLAARVAVFGIAALSLDFILGLGGMASFGHAAYLAIGAYAVAILDANAISSAPLVFAAAIGSCAAFALLSGAIALRTGGVNFIMITLAFAQMVYFATGSLADYGGDDGYTLLGRTSLLGPRSYVAACLICLALCYAFCRTAAASRFGRALQAVRQNRVRVQALGLSPFAIQLTAYVIAAAICGVAGVLLANGTEFVSPAYGAWQRSGDLLIMVMLGGAGTLHGAILGAAGVVVAGEMLGRLTEHWRLIYGPLLVCAVLSRRRRLR